METQNAIQQIYIGLLGRAADQEGLQYWTDEIEAGTLTLEQLRANIVNEQPEYEATFGGQTRAQVVTQLYANLFNRAPDSEGLQYWVNGDGAGVNIDQLVLALVNGASASDSLVLDNRTEVANYYITELGAEGSFNAEQAAGVIADVDGTRDSVTTAKANVDSGDISTPSTGDTFTLTDGIDNLSGTAGNDTFVGDNTGTNTVSAADSVDGGAGTDTLKLFGTAAVLPQVSNVENLYLNNPGAATINVASLSSVTSVELDNVEVTGAAAEALTLAQGQALTLDSVVDNTGGGHTLGVNGAASLTSLDLTLDGAGDASAGGNDLEIDFGGADALATLNVTTANNASRVTVTDADNAIRTVNVAGDQAVNLGTLTTNVNSFDASAMTAGGVTVDFDVSAGNTSITGSAADDTITADAAVNYTVDLGAGDDRIDVAGNLTKDDTIDGGAGTDTITASEAFTTAKLTNVSNFERAEFTDNLDQDLSILAAAGITTFVHSDGTADTIAVTKNEDSYQHIVTADQTNFVPVATTDDLSNVLNVELQDADIAAELGNASDATGYETINLTSSKSSTGALDGDANVIASIDASSGATVDVGGDAALTIEGSVNSVIVNAADLTGALDVTGSANADELTGGSGNDTFDGNGGNDTITLTAGGNDTVNLGATLGKATVDGFASGDKINIENDFGDEGENVITSQQASAVTATATHTQIVTFNASTTSITTSGTEKIADFTDLADVAAYLEEGFDEAGTTATDDAMFVLNDGTDSYIYSFDQVLDSTDGIAASEISLVGVVNGYALTGSDVDQTA